MAAELSTNRAAESSLREKLMSILKPKKKGATVELGDISTARPRKKSGKNMITQCCVVEGGKQCTAFVKSGGACPLFVCVAHGGGDRCTATNDDGSPCGRSAERATGSKETPTLCVAHGGGDRCTATNDDGSPCGRSAERATGSKEKATLCVAHGGGDRCPTCSGYARHVLDDEPICYTCGHEALTAAANDTQRANHIASALGLMNRCVPGFSGEHAFVAHINAELADELAGQEVHCDKATADGTKERADMFVIEQESGDRIGVHYEHDEELTHEDDMARLERLARGYRCSSVYVVRVCEQRGDKVQVPKRLRCTRKEGFGEPRFGRFKRVMTPRGEVVVAKAIELLRERLQWAKAGIRGHDFVCKAKVNFELLDEGGVSVEPDV